MSGFAARVPIIGGREGMARKTAKAPDLVHVSEACELLGCSRATLYRRLGEGAFRTAVINNQRYIAKADLDKMLKPKLEYRLK